VPPGMPPGPAGAIAYVSEALQKFPDLQVAIDDMIAEDDRVVVRNHWTATDSQTGKKLEFRGIVIWRIAADCGAVGVFWKRRRPTAKLITTSVTATSFPHGAI